jgi:hypothetical protein
MQCLSFITCIGCLFAMTYLNHLFGANIPYTEVQYVIGVAFIFVALQVRSYLLQLHEVHMIVVLQQRTTFVRHYCSVLPRIMPLKP